MIAMNNGSTVFDALNRTFSVNFEEFSGMGKLIIGINGIEQNSTYHWFYYVDDKFAQVATDKYNLYKNSNVLFKFTSENEFEAIK